MGAGRSGAPGAAAAARHGSPRGPGQHPGGLGRGGGILGGRTLPWRALAAGALLGLSGALTRAGALGAVAGLALRGFAIADEARGLQPREAMAGHNALVELPAACRGEAYSAGRQARW